ncbi:MAG: thioredoxin domain-containing protein [Deltaproteobacteria bacterium]|nr:thioredoxin domain-containing protein [Deltaproteobacteria bacterium]
MANAITKHPEQFMEAFQKANYEYSKIAQTKAAEQQKAQLEAELKNPKSPAIDPERAMLGDKNAPITLVTYSDFQCPYCQRGYQTVEEVRKKYGKQIRFVFKNLPLDFHPLAMPAAKMFEAIALQNAAKAYQFHDEIFKNQQKLSSGGVKFLEEAAKKLGVNIAKMKKDMESEKVKARIDADIAEARNFGINGTPGFVVAGVTIKGAYPASHFAEIIDRRIKDRDVAGQQK